MLPIITLARLISLDPSTDALQTLFQYSGRSAKPRSMSVIDFPLTILCLRGSPAAMVVDLEVQTRKALLDLSQLLSELLLQLLVADMGWLTDVGD